MSSIPGYDLESYIMWEFDIKVKDLPDANISLQIAESIGTATNRRKVLSQEEFKKIIELFEPYRKDVEYFLSEFDEDYQSWRDYSGVIYDIIPDKIFNRSHKIIK